MVSQRDFSTALGMTVMKIAIYGGTFDPVHCAHLILARQALEELELDRVIFIPAAVSPHKLGGPCSAAGVRLEMISAAIADEPGFKVDDCELRRPPPSYAIETVEKIRARDGGAKLFYLIGDDNVRGLHTWRRFDELQAAVEFVVLDRTSLESEHTYRTIRRPIDISASDIRNRVATGRSIRYLVPSVVEKIIRQHQLYREPQHHA